MRHQALVSSSQALYRVFVAPSLGPCSTSVFKASCTHPRPCLSQPATTTRRTIYAYAKVKPQVVPRGPAQPIYDPSILLDERIAAPSVHLVSARDGKLGELESLSQLLTQIDRETKHLRKVGETPAGVPIVKEFTKEALRGEAVSKSIAQAEKGKIKSEEALTKQVELTWAIAENDRGYRIAWLENFLREGKRVEVLIAPKKGGRAATKDEVMELLRIVRTAAKAIEGTKEWKAMEGIPGKQVMLHFQNEEQKEIVQEEKKVKAGEAKVEKLERKNKEREERREKQEKRLQKKKEEEKEKEKLRATLKS